MTRDNTALRAERDALRTRCRLLAQALSASESTVRRLTEQSEVAHDTGVLPVPDRDGGEGRRSSENGPASITAGPLVRSVRDMQVDASNVTPPAPALAMSDTGEPQTVGLPPAFEAFFAMNAARYTTYAQLHLPEDTVRAAVYSAFDVILQNWEVFLGHPQPAAWAWQVLRRSVAEQAGTVSPQLVLGQAMRDARNTFGGMTSDLGLFTAIAELPDRQFDVIVLHYVLGYSTQHISELLGLAAATVRFYERRAKGRLATKLGLRSRDDALPW
jgi:RNA polymerase sigma-70 factor (ECF subfamily)